MPSLHWKNTQNKKCLNTRFHSRIELFQSSNRILCSLRRLSVLEQIFHVCSFKFLQISLKINFETIKNH